MIGLIVAMNHEGVIGKNGTIPWRYPLDQKRFRRITMGSTVVMGRKTWEDIPPEHQPLKGRQNLIVSRHHFYVTVDGDRTTKAASVPSLTAAIECAEHDDIWIIGGSSIYLEALASNLVDAIDVTIVPDVVTEDCTCLPDNGTDCSVDARCPEHGPASTIVRMPYWTAFLDPRPNRDGTMSLLIGKDEGSTRTSDWTGGGLQSHEDDARLFTRRFTRVTAAADARAMEAP